MCPICGQALERENNTYRCAQAHSFDLAREGYVNLLPAHHKKTANPGDNKEMVKSRTDFLERGHYDIFSDALNQHILRLGQKVDQRAPFQILDAGCGEGFYLRKLSAWMQKQKRTEQFALSGIDISKTAVRTAARRDKTSAFAVASTYRMPIRTECLDFVCRIFAPGDASEIRRVLKNDGWLLALTPGPAHLAELKALCYDHPKDHVPDASIGSGLAYVGQTRLTQRLHLRTTEDIQNLLRMTPYYWHLHEERQQHVLAMEELAVKIDFNLTIYQKT
jgi:23S rRNA (guanine745-N1)-methyltransferase